MKERMCLSEEDEILSKLTNTTTEMKEPAEEEIYLTEANEDRANTTKFLDAIYRMWQLEDPETSNLDTIKTLEIYKEILDRERERYCDTNQREGKYPVGKIEH